MNLLIRNMFGNALKTNDSLLVKYRQQNDHKTSVGKCFSNNPKRDRAVDRRRNGSEENSKRINLSGNLRFGRKRLERAFHNRLSDSGRKAGSQMKESDQAGDSQRRDPGDFCEPDSGLDAGGSQKGYDGT